MLAVPCVPQMKVITMWGLQYAAISKEGRARYSRRGEGQILEKGDM